MDTCMKPPKTEETHQSESHVEANEKSVVDTDATTQVTNNNVGDNNQKKTPPSTI